MNAPLVFAATSDLAGKLRGKAFPLSALEKRLVKGVGWTPTNAMISCFDGIAKGPFGSQGDLVLIPDPAAALELDLGDQVERLMLSDIHELDGAPWGLCLRSILKDAIARLERVAGVGVIATFEHEFQLKGGPAAPGEAFGYQAFAAHRLLGEAVMGALVGAGMEADSFLREFGADQFEVTIGPRDALRAADEAVLLREIVRLIAGRQGAAATFSPIQSPAGVGNGVHVHMSLCDLTGAPVTWDPDGPGELSAVASGFVAGILRDMPALVALTAPADISYLRLTPHRWSAAYNNLGFRDREAAVRICPVTATTPADIARQFNFEYRAADAAASPHLALAALIHAGCQGIEDGLNAPWPTGEDLSTLSERELAARGVERLPETLPAALDRFASSRRVRGWFPQVFADVYLAHKFGELAELDGKDIAARCAAYAAVY